MNEQTKKVLDQDDIVAIEAMIDDVKTELDQLHLERDKSDDQIEHTDRIHTLIAEFIDLDYELRENKSLEA
jgi:hypothetical protein